MNPDKRPKLIALDLDGTLLNSDKVASPRTRHAISNLRDKGTQVVICTGRPARTAQAVAEALDLSDQVILYNGALIYNFEKEAALQSFEMDKACTLRAIQVMREAHPEAMAAIEVPQGWYTEEAYYEARKLNSELKVDPTGVGELAGFIQTGVVKLLFRHPTETAPVMSQALKDEPVHTTWSFSSLLEVSAQGVNKARALEWVAASHNISANEVAAFGDQHNDKEMLRWAGLGVAMGNAEDHVKASADSVTDSNDEDGVAKVLETWLF